MIWRDQILMDTESGTLVLLTTFGYNNKKYQDTIDYLFEIFKYCRNPDDPIIGAIRGHGEWIDEVSP